MYTIVCIHAFIQIFVIHAIILGYINDEYMKIYENEIDEGLEDRNTVVYAMEIVKG